MQKKFKDLYTPEEDIIIDESLVPWRGRLLFRQYLPAKAHKYGVKLFKLCSQKGYTWALQVYGRKVSTAGASEVGQAQRVCTDLTLGLRNEGRTLFVDNFYTSYPLAKFLLSQKTHVVGTLRSNKKYMPKNVMCSKLKRGEVVAKEDCNGIVVMKWKDTRDIYLLTTKHCPATEEINRRYSRPAASSSSQAPKKKPIAIIAYNKGKAGIDISDQMSSYGTCLRKGIKWYRRLAMELLLGMSVVNAYVLYKEVTRSKIGIREFREQLVTSLLDLPKFERHPKPKTSRQQHVLKVVENKSARTRRRCVRCYSMIQEKEGRQIAAKRAKLVNTFCV